nr:NSP5 [Murine rotavirus]
MSLSIDVTSLPSFSSSVFKHDSNSASSTISGKSIGRSEQYISPDAEAFNKYMLSKPPDDIGPSDSASNDPLTSFSIKSNAVKTNADAGVSMDSCSQSRPSSGVGCNQVDLALNVVCDYQKSSYKKDTTRSKIANHKVESHKRSVVFPKIEAESDSDEYVLDDSDSDDGKCVNCKYKRKYFALRSRMKQVAMQLIEDL